MEGEDARLKPFFKELYLSANPRSKNEDSRLRVKKQLLLLCYFLFGIRNRLITNVKRDLAMYMDSTGASNTSIDTLADLGFTTTSRTIMRVKNSASEEHATVVDSELDKYADKAMIDSNPPSKKRKGKGQVNYDNILLAAMKMPEAQLCHLPLGFNTSHKPDPFCYCDASNCFFVLLSTNTDAVIALTCGHTYHKSCYINNGSKCLHCLVFLQEGIDEQVQSLLDSLKGLRAPKKRVKKRDNDSLCDDKDNECGPVKYSASELEEALKNFHSLHYL
ncbi:hypothetical protein C2G38_2143875 [Gigaspora rosea]|uniref:Uncharacterized protein n=1 Tax=Gigaspora rosea TaxID=44941 RepID=A0A397V4D9_9GLOM|nr:hypothetical protein C2G38_2143875 [Gigaspora rosea]